MSEFLINVWLRAKALVRRRQLDRDLEEEMSFHLALREAGYQAAGTPVDEAHTAARLEFGNVAGFKEGCRDMWTFVSLENLWQDLRFAVRTLSKEPAFTAMAILSLGLGIGANTAVFTLVNDLLLKTIPVQDPDHLVSMGTAESSGVMGGLTGKVDIFPYSFYKQAAGNREVFREVAAYGSFWFPVSVRPAGPSSGPAEQAISSLVSGDYFHLLGVQPLIGREIGPGDAESPGSYAVAVLSYDYWQRRFSGDPAVLGKTIVVNGSPFIVIGVTPAKFYGVALGGLASDMWLPLTMQAQAMLRPSLLERNGPYWLHMIGRLQPGVSLAQAQQQFSIALRRYMADEEGAGIRADRKEEIQAVSVELKPGGRGVSYLRGQYAESLRILMAVVALVLLIACANLANFFLAKIARRQHEITTRLALGAGVSRIIRQMLTETLTIAFLGGALGLLLAGWGTRALISFVVGGSVRTPFDPNPDFLVLCFTFGISLVTGLLFGLAPAWQASRVSVASGMRVGSRSVSGGVRAGRFPLSKILVTVQVALSLVLLVGAGLFVRTLNNLENQPFGFDRSNVVTLQLDTRLAGYKPEQLYALHERLLAKVEAIPAVSSASLSDFLPLAEGSWDLMILVRGHVQQPHEDLSSSINGVSPRYFETAGIPLVAGRVFAQGDTPGSTKVAIVNQAMAKHFFPSGDALGKYISVTGDIPWQVVGVVKDGKYKNAREAPRPVVFLPLQQLSGEDLHANRLMVRTSRDPLQATADLRRALAQVDSSIPISSVTTLAEEVDRSLAREQLVSRLSSFFSLLALLLACIGLYGVMSYNVVRRSNEIGIRMALGAKARGVLWMVLRETVALLLFGIAIGVPVTLAATRYVESQLFGLTPFDPVTVLAAIAAISVVTITAGYLPARRATKVDPLVALRYE
ncbi:MAG: ABC transporter permease [Bryobacteraceae bacterium]